MSWRKWLVRGLVFAVVAGCVAAVWLYQRWTNPAAVRQQVIDKLSAHFLGANVCIDSARLRLLGGIFVTDVRLSRRDDPDRVDFAHIPSAIIYHDKEQLLHGKLSIRKLELFRPRLRVIRDRNGGWNLAGVLGPLHPEEPIPTIIVQQGTILVEDRGTAEACQCKTPGGSDALVRTEIKDVNFTLVNDPRPTLVFQGKGLAERVGALQVRGTWQRVTSALTVSVEAPAAPIQPSLIRWLAAYCPKVGEHAQELEGVGKVRMEFGYQPGSAPPWSHDLRCSLTQARFNHPQLPLPLDHLEVQARCTDGQVTVEKLTAQSGAAQVKLTGSARFPCGQECGEADFAGDLQVDHLALTPAFFGRLPEALRDIQTDYSPAGTVKLALQFGRRGGQWRKHCTIHPEELSGQFFKFPYRLERLEGTIDYLSDQAERVTELQINLTGSAGQQKVTIEGKVVGEKPEASVHLDIRGKDLPLDEKLEAALPARFQPLAHAFHPTGKADFVALIRRAGGAHEFANRFFIRFHDATIRYDVFPYPLENVAGTLDIQPGHWEFYDCRGTHKEGVVRCRGRSIPSAGGDRIAIEVSGTNLLLDGELEEALQPKLRQAWKAFAPAGRMSFQAQIDNLPGQPNDIDVTVNVGGCSMRPAFFPMLGGVAGTVRYARDVVTLSKFSAEHGGTRVGLDSGVVYLKQGGGFYAKLEALAGSPLVPDADLIGALPPALQRACQSLQLKDPVTISTQLIVDMPAEPASLPTIYWDGGLELTGARLVAGVPLEQLTGKIYCRGRHNGHQLEGLIGNVLVDRVTLFKQPLRNVHGHIDVPRDSPQVVRLPDLKAHLFGGDIGGAARIEFGPSLRYDVNLTALGINLEEFTQQNLGNNNTQVSGQVAARLYLTGRGTDVNGLEGRGTIDVPSGQMYNLPPLLELIKVLGLRPPDRTAFEEAHAAFEIHGPRVSVRRLDLYGSAISLSGQGEMNLDGSDLQLDFYAVWGRIVQWLPPLIKEIPPTIGQYLLKVKMRGKLGEVRFEKEPVPVLVDPVEKLLKRLQGLGKRETGGTGEDAAPAATEAVGRN